MRQHQTYDLLLRISYEANFWKLFRIDCVIYWLYAVCSVAINNRSVILSQVRDTSPLTAYHGNKLLQIGVETFLPRTIIYNINSCKYVSIEEVNQICGDNRNSYIVLY